MTDSPLLWLQDELEDDTITLEDNFLDIGGNSYLAMQLAEMLYVDAGFKLDMRRLYEVSLGEALAGAPVAVSG
ncbi:MAG TPA: phosphopantetheine-binding protein [Iamia sp.]